MRRLIFAVIVLAIPTVNSSLAGEAFVSQISGTKHMVSDITASVAEAVNSAKIASPLQLASGAPTGQMHGPAGFNYSSVVQVGTNNLAAIAQKGGNNFSTVFQHGTGNQALVSQRR